ncbi:hypothetical protein EB796_015212 [Bugula neritina]|uniref:Uncharacterized protein n=1 Tax=Bugula neritina TaxID=10212 RepID=A0A7J7JLD4_BUGNE|nr:hypothetical protein EB796_015212 [Bugula neritina]
MAAYNYSTFSSPESTDTESSTSTRVGGDPPDDGSSSGHSHFSDTDSSTSDNIPVTTTQVQLDTANTQVQLGTSYDQLHNSFESSASFYLVPGFPTGFSQETLVPGQDVEENRGFATSSGSHFPFDAHTSRRRDASSLMSLPARLTGSINDAPPEDETSHDSLRQPLLQRRRQPREERMLHLLSLYLIVPCWCLVIGFAAGCLNMADSCHVTFSLTSLAMATALCLVSARYEHKAKRGRH